MTADRDRSLLRRLWLRILATAGVTAAVLVTWWGKIEDARTPRTIPEIIIGQPVDLGRSRITPLAMTAEPDRLTLTVQIENLTGETQMMPFGSRPPELLLDDSTAAPSEIVLLRDQEPLAQLQPRLPETVALSWQTPAGWKTADPEIIFLRQNFKLRDNLYGQSSWLGFVPAARLAVDPGTTP